MDEFGHLPLRERKLARTRARIERTALEMFVRDGFERTTVAEIALACEIGERTFFSYFASKEDVVLADVNHELDQLALLVAERGPGQNVLDVIRFSAARRVALFRSHETHVAGRRAIEAANPRVHARVVLLREQREHAILAPEFARELDLEPTDPRVKLMTATFTGLSGALDQLIEQSPDDDAAHRILSQGLDLIQAALEALQASTSAAGSTGPATVRNPR